MSIYHETLWKKLEEKAMAADEGQPEQIKCGHDYLSALKCICDNAVALAKTIRDVFPLYTLHDEVHICNVMRLMEKLLGDSLEKLSRDEAAMLVLTACCHDIGMSCSEAETQELWEDADRLERYLEDHPAAYVKLQNIENLTELPDDLLREFLRSIHHERANDILLSMEWPDVLQGKVDRQDLIQVCQSHGKSADSILELNSEYGIDLRICAILLRLSDILDFDTSRAPQAVYYYSGFDNRVDPASKFSKEEWNKHLASHGFFFEQVSNRSFSYDLPYRATSPSMQIEQAVNSYIDWVDRELATCQSMLRYCGEGWRNLILPRKIVRIIKPEGYLSGQFCLTLDQERVLELLVGKNLYKDPGVFVRELLQNAIDAVRTRQQLDLNLPRGWKPQINIRCWMDEEGYHWFRIEDNGIGMNEEIIKKYFLKVGCSYYASSDFQQEKYRYQANRDYMPISRFGIGILSCFMGDNRANQVEISTKHFSDSSVAIRMSMHGIGGYYYLANRKVCPNPVEMKGVLPEEKRAYRNAAGTAIAVRTNLYQSGQYRSFREILDSYIAYPVVPVHYQDERESFDYPTEQELMTAIHEIQPSEDPDKQGVLEFSPTDVQLQELEEQIPGLTFKEKPKVVLKCVALDRCTDSPYLSGVVLLTKVILKKSIYELKFGKEFVETIISASVEKANHKLILKLSLDFNEKFKQRMYLFTLKLRSVEEWLHNENLMEYSPLDRDILNAIVYGYDIREDWCELMQFEHEISKAMLDKKVRFWRAKVMHNNFNTAEMLAFQDFNKVESSYSILLCDLEALPWYKQYFGENNGDKRHISLTAHNGVSCGDAEFFISTLYASSPKGVILLLKDAYRPEIDVARTGVRKLSLDAAVELAILRKEWIEQGYSVPWDGKGLTETEYWMIPQAVYRKLLERRPDLVKRLRFETHQGIFNAKELSQKLREFGKLELKSCPRLSNTSGYDGKDYLYEYFCMAYLRKEFMLCGKIRFLGCDVFVLPKPASDPQPYAENFPPSFFLPVEGDKLWISGNFHYLRCFCNAYHPLSKFIIEQQDVLTEIAPSLYWELMRSLALDDKTKVIRGVNECLKRIQSLPREKIMVPANAFLKESDFPK